MIDYFIRNAYNPLSNIRVDLGTDTPLWQYVQKAIQDIEIINVLGLNNIDPNAVTPFIHVGNWKWNPYPSAEEIQYRRRETGDKLSTKFIGNSRLGILEFDIYCGARDKNKQLETDVVHNRLYVPIEDDQGRYMIDKMLYSEHQLVDKLLYPKKKAITLKSLLPIDIKYGEGTEQSIDGAIYSAKTLSVKIFKTMEPILQCFMHVPAPLSYLEVFPLVQCCDHISDDKDQYDYFQPTPDVDIYVKGYKKGLDKFEYVRSILIMMVQLIRKYQPPTIDDFRNPLWWVYQLSYCENIVEHRGACHEMHVARMLDTISAEVLPIPAIDKTTMIALLRYVIQTDFSDINGNLYSYENKRLRLNEAISTIVTAVVSDKLKKMFRFGVLLSIKNMQPLLKFQPDLILKKMYVVGLVHVADFTNDLDYCQQLRFTLKGQLVA